MNLNMSMLVTGRLVHCGRKKLAYDLEGKLVIGVASSALFDLTESDAYFRKTSEEEYRDYQDDLIDMHLMPGAAFPFIKRLLELNDLRPENPLVEVIIMSKNDPVTGLRVMKSVKYHDLAITRAVFSRGRQTHQYIPAFGMSLFLSESALDVQAAIDSGHPAGQVLSTAAAIEDAGVELRIAFDFDGVLGDDSAETVYKEAGGLGPYKKHEYENRNTPIGEGPLKELLADLNLIQKLEAAKAKSEPTYTPRLRIILATARDAPAHERAVNSMREWGVTVDEAFFLGGLRKSAILKVLRPHIFFDDQTVHLDGTQDLYAGVHVPYGVANHPTESSES